MATHMAHRGQQREALYLARTLPPGDNMARVHVEIALAQYAGGQTDAASSTLIGAAKRLIGAENPLERAHALSILAAGLTQVGRDERAGDYFAEAFRLVRAADDGHDPDAALALARVAEQMAAVNRQKQARDLYELATRDVTPFWPEAGEMFTRMNVALKHIAISAGRSGFPDLAATAADYILTSERRNPAFREIAAALAEAGHIGDGIALLDKMTVAVERDLARAELARVLAEGHHFDKARNIIDAIQDPATAARARCQLAVAYHQQGADDQAAEMFAQVAGLLSQAEEDPFSEKEQQAVRRAYASALAACGQVAQAMRVLGPQKLDDVLALVGAWLPHLRGTSRNRALDVVREATRVAGWVRPDWGDVYAVLRG